VTRTVTRCAEEAARKKKISPISPSYLPHISPTSPTRCAVEAVRKKKAAAHKKKAEM